MRRTLGSRAAGFQRCYGPIVVRVLGIDGCAKGWVAIVLANGRFERAVFAESIATILAEHPASVVGIDMPIGAELDGFRRVDGAAKAFVGPRRSSVFETPPACVLDEPTFEAALARCRAMTGKGFSKQFFMLREKIREVASALDDRMIEVHPEVSFCAMNGAPLAAAKSTWSGHAVRRSLLARSRIELPADLGRAGDMAAPDDVLDAAGVAWSAHRHAKHESRFFEPAIRDGNGRVVTIWY